MRFIFSNWAVRSVMKFSCEAESSNARAMILAPLFVLICTTAVASMTSVLLLLMFNAVGDDVHEGEGILSSL